MLWFNNIPCIETLYSVMLKAYVMQDLSKLLDVFEVITLPYSEKDLWNVKAYYTFGNYKLLWVLYLIMMDNQA